MPRTTKKIKLGYPLSIKLSEVLIAAIDVVAEAQSRTRASVIRETLVNKFLPRRGVKTN